MGKAYELHMALMLSYLAKLDVIEGKDTREYFNPELVNKTIEDMEAEWIQYDHKVRQK